MRLDNTEGSSKQPTSLTDGQQDVLVGTLLGDGCLAKHGYYHRLHIKHSIAQLELAEFKYNVFRDFISMRLHEFDQQLRGKRYPCVQFATRTTSIFSEWHSRFYVNRRKVIPDQIESLLSPLALAVWIMDDGAADYAGITIQTHNFDHEEVERMKVVLGQRYGLDVRSRGNKGKRILYVTAASLWQLEEIVGPYMLTELEYKLIPRRNRTP